jgi:hypothetical protein
MDTEKVDEPLETTEDERKEKVLSVETRFPERHSGCA